jgi:hypothetical protein
MNAVGMRASPQTLATVISSATITISPLRRTMRPMNAA